MQTFARKLAATPEEWFLTLNYTDVERPGETPLGTIKEQIATFDADIPKCGAW